MKSLLSKIFKTASHKDKAALDTVNSLSQLLKIVTEWPGNGAAQDTFNEALGKVAAKLSANHMFEILVHSRNNGLQWKSLTGDHQFNLRATKVIEARVPFNKSIDLNSGDKLIHIIQDDMQTKNLYKGLLSNIDGQTDYLILTPEDSGNKTDFLVNILLNEIRLKNNWYSQRNNSEKQVQILKEQLTASEIKLRDTDRALKLREYEINNLLEISNELYSILDYEQLINKALLILVGQIGCEKTFAMLYNENEKNFSQYFSKGFVENNEQMKIDIKFDDPVVAFFLKNPNPVAVETLAGMRQFKLVADQFRANQIDLVGPIIQNDRVRGFIGLGEKLFGSAYDPSELQIFKIFINIISISLSNAQMYEEVKKLSLTDGMTSLHNYRYFEDRLKEELNRAKRRKARVSLLMIDIDHFKNYNDRLGHQAGDDALRAAGKILKNTVREDDIVNRYGGEEFVIIMPGQEKETISYLAERLRSNFEKHSFYKEEVQPGGHLTISLGGATYPDDARNFDELVKKADQALYLSKENGRNQFSLIP